MKNLNELEDLVEETKLKIQQVESQLKDESKDIKENAKSAFEKSKGAVKDTLSEWKECCSSSLSKTKDKLCDHQETIESKVKEKPITSLIAAFTVGLITSMVLTTTKKKKDPEE